ncbi:MAG: ADP-ribosylglycohydrolase family protein [Acholeplasmataceae bacterium]|nr:ADP-ribosylglycohydrolase family protein [Acholeplasmataceae bacterium]
MDQYIKGALVANAATLGFHWIYDSDYLEKLSKEQNLLFNKQMKKHFDRATPSYYVYPHAKIGSSTTQGMMLKWLYKEMKSNPTISKNDYEDLIYNYIKPGGSYEGYIETYGKRLILQRLIKDLNLTMDEQPLSDDHLVGFIPYLVCKELNINRDKAWELASAFTTLEDYKYFYQMFDYIFKHIKTKPLSDVLSEAIQFAPKSYQEKLTQAIKMDDTKSFIRDYAGTACHLPQSIPLIYHMLYRSRSYEEIIDWNAKLGGASSDRGLILGAVMAQISPIPEDWIKMTKI